MIVRETDKDLIDLLNMEIQQYEMLEDLLTRKLEAILHVDMPLLNTLTEEEMAWVSEASEMATRRREAISILAMEADLEQEDALLEDLTPHMDKDVRKLCLEKKSELQSLGQSVSSLNDKVAHMLKSGTERASGFLQAFGEAASIGGGTYGRDGSVAQGRMTLMNRKA